jgi:protein SCO1
VSQRVRLVLIGVIALLFAGFAGAWLAAGERRLTPDPGTGLEGFARPAGATVPQFTLTDQDGERVSTPDESPVVYAFIYSHCEDTCPVEVQQIRGAMDRLGRDVRVLGVSVDPANDTPASARAFLIEQHMTGRMDFLLGSRDELEPVWQAFGIAPQTEGREHSAGIVLTTGRRQRVGFPAERLTVSGLENDLRALSPSD